MASPLPSSSEFVSMVVPCRTVPILVVPVIVVVDGVVVIFLNLPSHLSPLFSLRHSQEEPPWPANGAPPHASEQFLYERHCRRRRRLDPNGLHPRWTRTLWIRMAHVRRVSRRGTGGEPPGWVPWCGPCHGHRSWCLQSYPEAVPRADR